MTRLNCVAVLLMLASCVQAAPVVLSVDGSFDLSGFTPGGVEPDPFVLAFSGEVTFDDSQLGTAFTVTTTLDSISPSPLTIGTADFVANDITLLFRSGSEENAALGLNVSLGIGNAGSIGGGTNDFRVTYMDSTADITNLPETLALIPEASLLANVGVGLIHEPSVQSGSVTISAIPEPSAFACLGLLGLVAGGRSWWKRR